MSPGWTPNPEMIHRKHSIRDLGLCTLELSQRNLISPFSPPILVKQTRGDPSRVAYQGCLKNSLLSVDVVWLPYRPIENYQTDQWQIQWRISVTEVKKRC